MSHPIPRRQLGHGLQVSALGLGCMGMSDFYGPSDHASNLAVLNHAIDMGMNFLDTADMYGVGRNEQLLAEVLATRRDEVVLATKFGNVRAPDGQMLGVDGSPEYVQRACDASLQRLGVETIDLYYQHRVDPKVPIEDTVGAMQRLVEQGKVRWLGLSEAAAGTIRRAAAVAPIAALQSEYSLWSRQLEPEILPTCRELGIGIVPYSPLGRGFLTGAIKTTEQLASDDWRRHHPRFADGNLAANLALVDVVCQLATELAITPAQLALAWLLHQGDDVVPIPGTRSIARLHENALATRCQLDGATLARLRSAVEQTSVQGERYHPAGMAAVEL